MLKDLVGAPEEHLMLEAVLLETRSFKKIHNRGLNAGEINHSAL